MTEVRLEERSMLEIADELKSLRDRKKDLDFNLRVLNKGIEEVEKDLIEIMTTDECESFKRNGTTFSLCIKEFPSAVKERKSELYDIMKEQGFEHLFTINSKTLQATLKELKSNNEEIMPDWLSGLVQVAEKTSIQVRNK